MKRSLVRHPAVRLSVALLLATAVRAEVPTPTTVPGGLTIAGPNVTTTGFSAADLAALPRHTVHVKDHDGHDATYEGVLLRDVLLKAGVPLGQHRLKGPLLAESVLVTSADGYKVVFGLAEFDADYAERDILLADRRDGQPLSAKEGPLRLVVPQEARQGRWARMVTGVRVLPPPN